MSERARLIMEREQRFKRYIEDKWTDADVARVEGLQAYYVNREMRKVATKFGLKLVPPRLRVSQDWKIPFGLDDGSKPLRNRLATTLQKFIGFGEKARHPHEMAYLTGMTTAEQRRALKAEHDWTISQIERFAKALGVPFQQLVGSSLALAPDIGKALDYGRHSGKR